jgi:hypothetical protein
MLSVLSLHCVARQGDIGLSGMGLSGASWMAYLNMKGVIIPLQMNPLNNLGLSRLHDASCPYYKYV